MNARDHLLLFIVASNLAVGRVCAQDNLSGQAQKQACVAQEESKGHNEKPSELICDVKQIFQSRIKIRPDKDPVEMTVGSPPMVSDDTETPGPANWEFNLVFEEDRSNSSRSYAVPLLDINYGIGDRLQLKYEVPYLVLRHSLADAMGNRVAENTRGVGDSVFGMKYRFYDSDISGLSLAAYPQIAFRTPGASLQKDGAAAETGTSLVLPLLVTKEFERTSITANLGIVGVPHHHHGSLFASFGVGTRLSNRVALMGELAGEGLNLADDRHLRLDAGMRVKLDNRQSISAAVGQDIRRSGDGEKHYYLTLAYQRLIEHDKR